MKNLMISLMVLLTSSVSAQNTVIWKGGTPGKETNWEEPRNWSGQQLPDEDTYVIIKKKNSGHNAQPVIKSEVIVAEIEIHAGAVLTVATTGLLTIDGEFSYSEGLVNYGGQFFNKGAFEMINVDESETKGLAESDEKVTDEKKITHTIVPLWAEVNE